MATETDHTQDDVSRQIYLNPYRPYLKDLVPELAALPKKEQLQVEKEVGRRLRRNRRYLAAVVPSMALSMLVLVLACGVPQVIIVKLALVAPQLPPFVQNVENLERMYNDLARDNPDYPPFELDTAAMDKVFGSILWIRDNSRALGLPFVALLFVCALFWSGAASQWENRIKVPYIHDVLAERRRAEQPPQAPDEGKTD